MSIFELPSLMPSLCSYAELSSVLVILYFHWDLIFVSVLSWLVDPFFSFSSLTRILDLESVATCKEEIGGETSKLNKDIGAVIQEESERSEVLIIKVP